MNNSTEQEVRLIYPQIKINVCKEVLSISNESVCDNEKEFSC